MCDDITTDIRARVTRIETRLVKIAQSIGIETGTPGKGLKLRGVENEQAYVYTDSFCVSLADIHNFLTKEGIQDKVCLVYFGGQLVARVYPLGEGS